MENYVRTIRRKQGLSMRKLHQATGISLSFIYYIETGQKVPNVYHAQRLAQALGTTVEELFPFNPSSL